MAEEIKSQVQEPKFVEVQPKPSTSSVTGRLGNIFDDLVKKLLAVFESFPSKFQNIDNQKLLKIFKVVAIVFVSIVSISFVASKIVNFVKRGNGNGEVPTPAPTIVPYQVEKPSVYAEDEKVLEIEERAKTLDKQMSDTVVRETILNPPSLDFDIDFKIK